VSSDGLLVKRIVKLLISLLVRTWDIISGGFLRLTGRRTSPSCVVLYYHAIRSEERRGFAKQMDTLLDLARPWRLDGQIEQPNGRHVAVTFDDAYVSVIENAVPELKQRGIPYTVFVPTGSWGRQPSWVSNPNHPFWKERVVSREELRASAAEPLATIGSHTVHHPNHPNLVNLSAEEAGCELTKSKSELEEVLARPVKLFSFPHGAHNARLVTQALEAGYQRLFTIEPKVVNPATGATVMGRVAVEPVDWPLEFRLKVLGAYRWMARSPKAD
jgi:peptidoglycan/xylan/chitin deacetylase (PgdA/CDA1 family)